MPSIWWATLLYKELDMEKDPRLGFLGILYVSQKAIIGEDFISHLDKVRFVIMANDISSGQGEAIKKKILARHLPISETFSSKELGLALGHSEINFIGITDKKAAMAYISKSMKGAAK